MRIAQMTTSSALSRVSWQIPNETEILRGRWCRVWWYQGHHFKGDIMMIWRGCDQTLISLQNLYKHEWQRTCPFLWGQCMGTTEMKAQNKRRLLYQVVGFSIFLFTAFLGHDCPWLIFQGCKKNTNEQHFFWSRKLVWTQEFSMHSCPQHDMASYSYSMMIESQRVLSALAFIASRR